MEMRRSVKKPSTDRSFCDNIGVLRATALWVSAIQLPRATTQMSGKLCLRCCRCRRSGGIGATEGDGDSTMFVIVVTMISVFFFSFCGDGLLPRGGLPCFRTIFQSVFQNEKRGTINTE